MIAFLEIVFVFVVGALCGIGAIRWTFGRGGPTEMYILCHSVGNCLWLDNLTDEQWQIIKRDILPVLQREDLRRDNDQSTPS